MNRREALRNVAVLMGGALSATTLSVISEGCKTSDKKGELFTAEQQSTITELADTIIPTTGTPGAKAAGVGSFIAMMIKECYPENVQKIFTDGLDDLDQRSKSKFSNSFVAIDPKQRAVVLQEVVDKVRNDKEKDEKEKRSGRYGTATNNEGGRTSTAPSAKKDPNFFQLAKELTMLGYFTSEIGCKQALVYTPVPGKYESCTDVKPGQKAWAL
jgi:hypothetical protein